MRFIVELASPIGNHRFRLQNYGGWRKTQGETPVIVLESDRSFENLNELIEMTRGEEHTLDIEGEHYTVNPRVITLPGPDKILHYDIKVDRKTGSDNPRLEQLRETISQGNDNRTNSLILAIDGNFYLRSTFYEIDPTVVVRFETFMAGNGYVGPEASEDAEFISRIFEASLKFWDEHLKDGTTNEYCDTF